MSNYLDSYVSGLAESVQSEFERRLVSKIGRGTFEANHSHGRMRGTRAELTRRLQNVTLTPEMASLLRRWQARPREETGSSAACNVETLYGTK